MGILRVVATPIGNLEDVSPRALRTLREADRIFAEDTRRTRILLDRYDIATRPVSLHEHNEASRIEGALELLREGASLALVSDAGTPLISDPGARLVAAAIEDDHQVEPIPGPSAVLSALSVAGFVVTPFAFVGFLPRTKGARAELLKSYLARPEALVFFESPRRVGATLGELADCFEHRRACVARELTKRHEEIAHGSLADLAKKFMEEARGEFTIVVEGAGEHEQSAAEASLLVGADLDAAVRRMLGAGRRPREIAAELASQTSMPRKQLYTRIVSLKDQLEENAGEGVDE